MNTQNIRYHYLDNLRAFAMLAGIFFHAAASHSGIIKEAWPTSDTNTSFVVDALIWVVHTFRMPLFFLVAGFFAHYLVKKYGLAGFIKNRAKRIALPFILFWPIMAISLVALFYYVAMHMPVQTPVMDMIKLAITNPEAMGDQKPPVSTTHLWFLYYLAQFCLLAALAYRFLPSMPRLYSALSAPLMLILILPLATGVFLLIQHIPHPAPESFKPALWAYGFFGIFFCIGWVFFVRQTLLERLSTYLPYLLGSSLLTSGIFVMHLPEPVTLTDMLVYIHQRPALSTDHIIRAFCTGILSWHLTLVSLILAYRFMNWQNATIRYIADASYWLYVMHLPVVFYLQAFFHTQQLPIFVEFLGISAGTLLVGFASYALLIRPTPIGWLFNGKRNKPRVFSAAKI